MGALIALGHHEKYDGSGYPERAGRRPHPAGARIVAVADVFDALTSVRPYKRAWSIDEGLEFMRTQRGKHFDPTVIDAFLSDRGAIETVLREFGD